LRFWPLRLTSSALRFVCRMCGWFSLFHNSLPISGLPHFRVDILQNFDGTNPRVLSFFLLVSVLIFALHHRHYAGPKRKDMADFPNPIIPFPMIEDEMI
jgi:hypothetical protein